MNTLDVKNLGCPIPAINLRKAFKKMQPGDQLSVVCNAKDVLNDLRAAVKNTKNILVSESMDPSGKVPVWTLIVQRAA